MKLKGDDCKSWLKAQIYQCEHSNIIMHYLGCSWALKHDYFDLFYFVVKVTTTYNIQTWMRIYSINICTYDL